MNKKILLLLSGCMTLHCASNAGGFKIGMQGIKQLGMGHTGVGFAQDAATIYFNPAGMSFTKTSISAGMNALIPSISFLEKGTNTITNATSQVFTPLSMYGQLKLSKRIDIGIGVYTPFGSGVSYPNDWSGKNVLTDISLETVFIQPTISLRLTKKWSIGGGLVFANGVVNLQKDLPIASSSITSNAHAELEGKAKGNGYNIGLYYKGDKRMSFGAAFHSKLIMKVDKGTATFSNIPTVLASTFPVTNTFKSELNLPSELAIGTSFKLNQKVTFAADFNYTYWKTYDSLGFDYATNTSAITDAKSPRLYKNALGFKAGIQANVAKNVQLRGGAFYDQTPIQNGYVAPELPDNDKLGLTCGASLRLEERLQLDFSLLYENVFKRTQTNIETGMTGTFQTKVIAPGIGLSWQIRKKLNHTKNY
jgi:long-chain fatty acid transport protein